MYIIFSNFSPSLKILSASLSYCIYNVMHKSTLITYFMKAFLKNHSIRKLLKLSFGSSIFSDPFQYFSTKLRTYIPKY